MSFAAGTVVHTNNGLKPIELVRPGDRVLSMVKGQAKPVYQRVLRTLRETRQAVCWVRGQGNTLIATRSHPFFVAGYDWGDIHEDYRSDEPDYVGWRRADQLADGTLLELHDGRAARATSVPIYRTQLEDTGWVPAAPFHCESGHLINVSDGINELQLGAACMNDFMDADTEQEKEDRACKTTVYHFEVAHFHTFYVGKLGVLVHDVTVPAQVA
jgi:hypothetical protein